MKTQDHKEEEIKNPLPRTSKLRFDEACKKANEGADRLLEELSKPFVRHADLITEEQKG